MIHKKNFGGVKIVLMILAILVIAGVLFWQKKTVKVEGNTVAFQVGDTNFSKIDRNKDSDSDSLKDWEEAIYGTDSHNSDTDGDGLSDKEEIVSGHDPLKKGPDDKLGVIALEPRPAFGSDVVNLTNAFADKIIQNISTSKIPTQEELNAGWQLPGFNPNDFLQTAGENLDKSLTIIVPEAEIKIIESNKETITDYVKKADIVFSATDVESPEILQAAIKDKDFAGLDKAIITYGKMYDDFKKLEVPSELKDFHKDALGILYKTRELLTDIRQINIDPLKAGLAWKAYNDIFEKEIPILIIKTAKALEKYHTQPQ